MSLGSVQEGYRSNGFWYYRNGAGTSVNYIRATSPQFQDELDSRYTACQLENDQPEN